MNNLLTIEDCDTVAKKCLKTDQVKTVDFSAVRLQNQNFLLKITVNHNQKEKTLNFFAKSGFVNPIINQILHEFQNAIPQFDMKVTPKLYYNKSDIFLFEDLSWQGFRNYNLKNSLDPDHIKTVLKVLAEFHAGSFAYEDIKSKEIQKDYKLDQEYKFDYCSVDLTKSAVTELISTLVDDKLSEVVKNLEDRQSSTKFRRTLCHGNLTVKNIMFRYKNGKPVECKLINFKSKLYAPPIVDVLQLIFFNSGENLRQQYYHSLLAFYYDCLDEELKKYHLKIDDIVPSQQWQVQSHQLLPVVKLECLLRKKNVSSEELKEDLHSPLLSRQDCYAIVANKLKSTNYDLISFQVTHLSSANGCLGDYNRLQIKVCHQSEPTTINCFIKCMPKSSAAKDVVNDSNSFSKEIFVYNTIIPKFEEMGIKMVRDCLPICYFQRVNDLMVFEDMDLLGYKTTLALNPYDFDTLCMVIKKVAKFHASALIYEEKMSEKLGRQYRLNEEYKEYFKESLIVDDENHSGGRLIATGLRTVPYNANLFPELQTEENRENLSKFYPELRRLFFSTITASKRFRNVLSHGDLWTGNILLKFVDDKAVDCSFVDYQLLRYCPPGHDFVSVLYLTTIRDIRLKHEENLKRVYYEELTHLVKSFGYDVTTILSYEDFLGGIDLMRPEMVLQAAIYGMFSMCTPEQISSMLNDEEESHRAFFVNRHEFTAKMCQMSPIYKSRLRDRMHDLFDYCKSMNK